MLVAAVVVACVACVLYGVIVERRWYRLVRLRLDILPADGPQTLTVLHLSDLHFTSTERKKARFLAGLPKADVTVITGDFLAEPQAVEAAAAAVAPVRGRLASWFVLGSNDYFVPRPLNYFAYFYSRRKSRTAQRGRAPDLVAALVSDGWQDLTNARNQVSIGGLQIELLGLDDAHMRTQDYRVAPRKAPERFGIAVMHSPDSAAEAAALGYRLLLAGHTHGGQVCVPGFGALVTNCSMPARVVKGLASVGDSILHTSPGLGTSKYAPFRFACRPEATLIELSRPGAGR
jgi:predicted MPP superfamily phosphohydrolase